MAGKRLSDGCLCGAVLFREAVKNGEAGICHCGVCRRWSGVSMSAGIESDWEQAGKRAPAVFDSSEWGQRLFCPECGTPLGYRVKDDLWTGLAVGVFDEPDGFELASEIFIDKKPDFYSFTNATHKVTGAEVVAQFNQQRD